VTAFVRFEEPRAGLLLGRLNGRLELYPADTASSVTVAGGVVPLELEPTSTLALGLEGAQIWKFEIAGFRFGDERVFGDGLILRHPYRPGRVPVVLVHGTASSPARWAEMINELSNDTVIGQRIQFWLFMYNTGQPILHSAHLLRQALKKAAADFDPEHRDPALRRMVIIGHSQGGLLTKLLATSSGTRFWDNVSSAPFDAVDMTPNMRAVVRDGMFFEPLPEVSRVIFISTPHRGSFRAAGRLLGLADRLVRLPGTMVSQVADMLTRNPGAFSELSISHLPTSVDNMSPTNRFLRTLASLPIDSRIHAHSIIPVRKAGSLAGQTDGVVAYESAHIEGVKSELVVRSGHSTQSHPDTIEEVRRILREHVGPP
jgi:pimeloyl-ACP methyl ester carboxylesterase